MLRFQNLHPGLVKKDLLGILMSFGKIEGLRVSAGKAVALFEKDGAVVDALDILTEHKDLVQRRLGHGVVIDTFYHTRSKDRNTK